MRHRIRHAAGQALVDAASLDRAARYRQGALALVWVGLLAVIHGCPQETTEAPVYQARGQIAGLPGQSDDSLVIRHEAISGFRDREGKKVGMQAMTMAFGRAADVDISGLSEGDKIRFEFEVRWKEAQPLRVTRIERLPQDTALQLAEPKPSHSHRP